MRKRKAHSWWDNKLSTFVLDNSDDSDDDDDDDDDDGDDDDDDAAADDVVAFADDNAHDGEVGGVDNATASVAIDGYSSPLDLVR